ncbi:hypothetical protein SEA_CICADA_10 [Microbacterium phage Cicada]|nr:hypothetical protein SEA_CICADA_10 [Microbacterium phage Cicada]
MNGPMDITATIDIHRQALALGLANGYTAGYAALALEDADRIDPYDPELASALRDLDPAGTV